jgi:hypothetical protein
MGEIASKNSETVHPRHRTASLIVLGVDVIGLLFLLYCTTVAATKFRHIYDELLEGAPLPVLTRLMLSIPQPFFSLLLIGGIAGVIYKETRITNRTLTLVLNLAVLGIGVILFLVFVTAMFLPLVMIYPGGLSA